MDRNHYPVMNSEVLEAVQADRLQLFGALDRGAVKVRVRVAWRGADEAGQPVDVVGCRVA